MPVRVLHVCQPTTAGTARVVAELASHQVDLGWSVTIASPEGGELSASCLRAGAHHRPWDALREPGTKVLDESRALARIVRDVRPEVVHLHSSKAGLAGRLTVRGRIPTAFQPHAWSFCATTGSVGRAVLIWERMAARWTEAYVCVSEEEASAGRRAGLRGRWEIAPNGTDVSQVPVSPDERYRVREELELPGGLLVVCLGRIAEQKGQDLLLAAWPEVLADVPGARLALVGDGPALEGLRGEAKESVLFTGHREDAGRWLAAADLVVVPSRWEGASLSLLEAMAAARCIVASAAAGAAEVLGRPESIVPVEDIVALRRAIVERLRDSSLREREALENRHRVERIYDLRKTLRRYEHIYATLLARERAISAPEL
jgi:glycosyltransferase involved in cell wall biosynthesis